MADELIKQIGATIRKIRNNKGLSIEDVAGKASIHSTYLAQVERGQRNLSIKALSQIASALDVKLTSLIPGNPIAVNKDSYAEKFITITNKCDDKQKDIIINTVKELAKKLDQHF